MNERFTSNFELKSTTAEGVFEGYASIFDEVDDGRDVIRPGAFAKTLTERSPLGIKLLWQHNPTEPIGTIEEIREDARGLFVRGRLEPTVKRAEEALALMKAGALDGLSIGYHTVTSHIEEKSGVRVLEELELWEVSLVTFPMQRMARVAYFKGNIAKTKREFEGFLRDAGGFSRAEAKRLTAFGYDGLDGAREAQAAGDLKSLAVDLRRLSQHLSQMET